MIKVNNVPLLISMLWMVVLGAIATTGVNGSGGSGAADVVDTSKSTTLEKQTKQQQHAVLKRSFNPFYGFANGGGGGGGGGGGSGVGAVGQDWSGFAAPNAFQQWNNHRSLGPSPMEVASAIATAKQASANVLIAQQQVQAAKENVLHQQRLATDKEAHASILTQKSEAAAAIQRSEAAAAAQSVILAQQRLASAKNMVAQQQRIAATKEAQAAAALQSSAHAAADEIRRTENEAARLASVHRTDSAAASHHVAATKDAIIGPLHAGNNHVLTVPFPYQPHNPYAATTLASNSGDHYGLVSASPWNTLAAVQSVSGAASEWPVYPYAHQKAGYNVWG